GARTSLWSIHPPDVPRDDMPRKPVVRSADPLVVEAEVHFPRVAFLAETPPPGAGDRSGVGGALADVALVEPGRFAPRFVGPPDRPAAVLDLRQVSAPDPAL